MFCGVKKLLSFLLALAVLLAPLEFAVAHDMDQMKAASEMMQHVHQQQSQIVDDGSDQACGSQGSCTTCVYCSPALSVSAEITLDKPDSVLPQAVFISQYSIDLPVEFRPPRQL